LEAPLLQYLPWRKSPFADIAGFPNLFLLRFALVAKTLQNLIVLCCQFIIISGTSSSSSSLSPIARTFLYINVSITITVAVLGFLEGYLKRSLLSGSKLSINPDANKVMSKNDKNDADPYTSSYPNEKGIELRESTTTNPLAYSVSSTSAAAFVAGRSSITNLRDTIPARQDDMNFFSSSNDDSERQERNKTMLDRPVPALKEIERKLQRLEQRLEQATNATNKEVRAVSTRVDALVEATRPLLLATNDEEEE